MTDEWNHGTPHAHVLHYYGDGEESEYSHQGANNSKKNDKDLNLEIFEIFFSRFLRFLRLF